MFVVIVKYVKPIEEIDKVLVEHRAFLDKYYQSGHLICSGPQNPRTGGVILAKAASKNELEKILAQDPFAQNKVAEYEILEFDPIKYSKDFATCLKNN